MALQEQDSISVAEAGEMLDVSRSTAYRLLSLLEHREFVRQDLRTKFFHSGPALVRVGLAAVRSSDIRRRTRPLLEEVVAKVDETAHLVVLEGERAFFLDCVESSRTVRAGSRVGHALPAHCTSGGKVLLADLPDSRLEELLQEPLPAMTRRSKTSPAKIRAELRKIHKRGWALNDGESEAGLRAVAIMAPPGGSIPAAIAVSGPASRITAERIDDIVRALQRAAANQAAAG